MNDSAMERLLHHIGEIEDFFLEEAETFDLAHAKTNRRKRMVKYGAFGAAGLAVSAGMAVVLWKFRLHRLARSA